MVSRSVEESGSRKVGRRALGILALMGLLGCASSRQAGPVSGQRPEPGASEKAEPGASRAERVRSIPVSVEGSPEVKPSFSSMAQALNLAEGLSLWNQQMPRTLYRAYEERYGIQADLKGLLKKFAFIRAELEEKVAKNRPQLSFEVPLGPEGLFPLAALSLVEKFWLSALSVQEPKELPGAVGSSMEPTDGHTIAAVLGQIWTKSEELSKAQKAYAQEIAALSDLLNQNQVKQLLARFARSLGIDGQKLHFEVHPVWGPADAGLEAAAYGQHIILVIPEGKPVGPSHAALVVHEIGRRMLATLGTEKKSVLTLRFLEKAGWDHDIFLFTEGVLDALSHGMALALWTGGSDPSIPWPGDEKRKKFAEALLPMLEEVVNQGKPLDAGFALKAAQVRLDIVPAKPSHFLAAAMVVGEDWSIKPFRAQVARWTVWKFPPSKNYDYPKKLEESPGRSVFFIVNSSQLRDLIPRFTGPAALIEGMNKAIAVLKQKQSVLIALPRESRGYLFILAAPSEAGMRNVAKKFFALDQIPSEPVVVP